MDEEYCLGSIKTTLLQNCGSHDEDILPHHNILTNGLAKLFESCGWPKDSEIPQYKVKNLTNHIYYAFVNNILDGLFEDPEISLKGIGVFRHDTNCILAATDYNIAFEPVDDIKKIYAKKQGIKKKNTKPINARKAIMNSLEKRLGNSANKIISTNFERNYDDPLLNKTANMLYDTFVESFKDMTIAMNTSALAPDLGKFTINPPYFKPDKRIKYGCPPK